MISLMWIILKFHKKCKKFTKKHDHEAAPFFLSNFTSKIDEKSIENRCFFDQKRIKIERARLGEAS